jgi:hypothetical protein
MGRERGNAVAGAAKAQQSASAPSWTATFRGMAAAQVIVHATPPLLQQLLPAVVAALAGLVGVWIGQRGQRGATRAERNIVIYSRFLAQCHEVTRNAHFVTEAPPNELQRRYSDLRDVVARLRAAASEIELVGTPEAADDAKSVAAAAILVSDGLSSRPAISAALGESVGVLARWQPLAQFEQAVAQLVKTAKEEVR